MLLFPLLIISNYPRAF